MEPVIGEALVDFEKSISELREKLACYAAVVEHLFRDTEEWTDLLTFKLVPHLAGEGCLVVAVAGGTNTGKSSIFNLLLGKEVSPVVNTAAATCHPVIAANALRAKQCLEAKLVPEFTPLKFTDPTNAIDRGTTSDALFVAEVDGLPDHMVVMDTPDIDSIDKINWEVAEHIRAAGDVLVGVVTGDKYKDDRVVEYFREAISSGRRVIPLLNKANPENDFEVARQQLAEFRKDVGIDEEGFVIAHDFQIAGDLNTPIRSLGDAPDLRVYLRELDVHAIKEEVFRDTVRHFAQQSGVFIDTGERLTVDLARLDAEFEARSGRFAEQFDPLPGEAVGGLFHEFVQSKRGPLRRAIGSTSSAFARGAGALGRGIGRALRSRATLENEAQVSAKTITDTHRRSVERIVQDLCAAHVNEARVLEEPIKGVLVQSAQELDVATALERVLGDALSATDLSDEFREHANAMLESWWEDHKGKRRILESLDIILAVMPAAIAAPIAIHTGGIGASEAAIAVGPIAAQFVTRVMEFQFGDAMFDFLSPWKKEQQEGLARAFETHITTPMLSPARSLRDVLESETFTNLRRCQDQCLKA